MPNFNGKDDKEGFNTFSKLVKNWAQALYAKGQKVMEHMEKLDDEVNIQ